MGAVGFGVGDEVLDLGVTCQGDAFCIWTNQEVGILDVEGGFLCDLLVVMCEGGVCELELVDGQAYFGLHQVLDVVCALAIARDGDVAVLKVEGADSVFAHQKGDGRDGDIGFLGLNEGLFGKCLMVLDDEVV